MLHTNFVIGIASHRSPLVRNSEIPLRGLAKLEAIRTTLWLRDRSFNHQHCQPDIPAGKKLLEPCKSDRSNSIYTTATSHASERSPTHRTHDWGCLAYVLSISAANFPRYSWRQLVSALRSVCNSKTRIPSVGSGFNNSFSCSQDWISWCSTP